MKFDLQPSAQHLLGIILTAQNSIFQEKQPRTTCTNVFFLPGPMRSGPYDVVNVCVDLCILKKLHKSNREMR